MLTEFHQGTGTLSDVVRHGGTHDLCVKIQPREKFSTFMRVEEADLLTKIRLEEFRS